MVRFDLLDRGSRWLMVVAMLSPVLAAPATGEALLLIVSLSLLSPDNIMSIKCDEDGVYLGVFDS